MIEMLEKNQQCARDDVAALEAQIEQLKQAIVLLQAQLVDMREQKDKWQCRAERVSLVAGC
jgi:predicted  nucleic acid-binding Zn-ribbon protein